MNRVPIQLVLCSLLAAGSTRAQDTTPPMLVSAGSLNGTEIGVCFSEAMDEFSLQNAAAYAVSDSNGTAEIANVTAWPGDRAVVLHLLRAVASPFTVEASDLYDLAFNSLPPNSVVTGRVSTVGFESGTVGAPAGSAFLSCEADRLSVLGNDLATDTSDQLDWLYVRRTNDFDVNVRLEQVSGLESAIYTARCGLMVRGSPDAGSPMVRLTVVRLMGNTTNQSGDTIACVKRLRQDAERKVFWGDAIGYPAWLRIKRQRNLFSAYWSSNAVDWVRVDGPEPLRNLPPVVLMGLVTWASEIGSLTSATYSDFGDTRLWPEATIQLTQQPASTTVEEHQSASFVARAEVTGAPADELRFQWQAESNAGSGIFTNIFLATAPSCLTPPLGKDSSGVRFRVIASLSGGPTVVSAPATVTVLPDRTGPRIVAARAANDLQAIILMFSEPLEPSAAVDKLNYSVPGFDVGTLALNSVGDVVTLPLDHPLTLSNTYQVEVSSLGDLTGHPIEPNPASAIVERPVIARGFARQDLYFDTPGSSLSDLRQAAKFPQSPDETSYVARLEGPHNAEDEYGVRLTGFLVPPVTGAYHFWMCSDDEGQFWLSTDEDPGKKVLICREPQWNGWRDYLGDALRSGLENRSSTLFPDGIPLVANRMYFFEALEKEGGGDDNLSVAWQIPGHSPLVNGSPPIAGAYLASLISAPAPTVQITQQPTNLALFQPTAGASVGTLLNEDFSTNGGCIANVAGDPAGGWIYDPILQAWYAEGSGGGIFPSEKTLTSPLVTITRSGSARIRFAHRYSFEPGLDGGQLRVSVNGAPFRPVPAEAFTQNGYTGAIGGIGPLYEQTAFNGDSPGYLEDENATSIADLGYVTTHDTLAVRFLGGWDFDVKGAFPNWLLKSLILTEGNPGWPAATFSIQAHASLEGADSPLSYQWQRDSGAGFMDIVGANADEYTFVPALADNGSRFRCRLYGGSTATSAVVTLTIVLPALSIARTAGNIVLSWPGEGVLQEANSISGPWTEVPGTSDPRVVPAPLTNRFYRVRGM